jgi:dTDP-4-dehydrorhamnose reductase
MAKHLESIVRTTTLLTPGHTRSRIAPRPRDVTLDCSKIRRLGMVFKSMDQGLMTVRKQLQERTSYLGISKVDT